MIAIVHVQFEMNALGTFGGHGMGGGDALLLYVLFVVQACEKPYHSRIHTRFFGCPLTEAHTPQVALAGTTWIGGEHYCGIQYQSILHCISVALYANDDDTLL